MKTELRIAIAGVALAVLSACGAKGPLFLPEKAAPVEVPEEPATNATPTDLPDQPPIEVPADAPVSTPPATTPAEATPATTPATNG